MTGIIIIGITLTVLVIRYFSSSVALGPQQVVQTINPKMGVHTRLTDEVEPWKIKQSLTRVREMGAPWIVEYFPWANIEESSGRFNWAHADRVNAQPNR